MNMKSIILILTIIIVILSITVGFLVFKTEQKQVEIPEETAIQLASSITVLRPSFMNYADVKKALKGGGLAGYELSFLRAEEESGIGADVLISIAKLESGNGTNYYWKEWNNCFSWGITDSGPNLEAYKIKEMGKSEAIVYTAKKIKELYLTPGGAFYSGETLSAINKYYASDKTWASKILAIQSDIIENLTEEQRAKIWVMSSRVLRGDLPSPKYFTSDYFQRPMTREELAIILYRINSTK